MERGEPDHLLARLRWRTVRDGAERLRHHQGLESERRGCRSVDHDTAQGSAARSHLLSLARWRQRRGARHMDHSFIPEWGCGARFDTGQNFPRMAATQRADDIISWQNALVDALGPDSQALGIGIYDTEVNYGLKGPGARPGVDWSTEDGNQLMDYTYADSRMLGITATFWYQYTATDYSLLGVQWSNAGGNQLSATWDSLRASGPGDQRFNSVSSPLYLSRDSDYVSRSSSPVSFLGNILCGRQPPDVNLSGANCQYGLHGCLHEGSATNTT